MFILVPHVFISLELELHEFSEPGNGCEQTIKYASPTSAGAECMDGECRFQHQW